MKSSIIKIFIVDDHPLVREGIGRLLSVNPSMQIVGQAGSMAETLKLLGAMDPPDVLLLDISLPDGSGIDLARTILEISNEIRILFLSMHEEAEFVRAAFQAGASGYVLKTSSGEEVLLAVAAVHTGNRFISPALGGKVVDESEALSTDGSKVSQVTERELEVLSLVVKGNSAKEIAEILSISHRTVETHRQNLIRKLGAKNSADLVRMAIDFGFVKPSWPL